MPSIIDYAISLVPTLYNTPVFNIDDPTITHFSGHRIGPHYLCSSFCPFVLSVTILTYFYN